ncbi:hypothetical protein HP439_05795 [Sphingobacterium shayense]|uniref:hypothetical protein n=1 Tax=Sphingobacterium shayense TaxID=626343 RepID=UPI001551CC91|nr:hypothetical protein [Sphingobacterium shayense]NQD70231.1 hypothetical protein [Sphingobacterium shayense]
MKNKKIALVAKTDINTDGRIINQINILLRNFQNISFDFIILPDKPIKIKLNERVRFHQIKCLFRNNPIFRIFTILEFTWKVFFLLKKIRPDVIHLQDSAGSLPVLLYKKVYSNSLVVYDDHEIPNENATAFEKLNVYVENRLIKACDFLIEANEERLTYIKDKLFIKSIPSTYFLNLPYDEELISETDINDHIKDSLEILDNFIQHGGQFIIHQGPLKIERGRALLARFSECISQNQKILLVGGTRYSYETFIQEYNLSEDSFIFIGTIAYKFLPLFWGRASYSIIMYLPNYLNNKLCAPNRYYLSLKYNIPTIVNKSNPVLNSLIIKNKNGAFIEDIITSSFSESMLNVGIASDTTYAKLEMKQVREFCDFYQEIFNSLHS